MDSFGRNTLYTRLKTQLDSIINSQIRPTTSTGTGTVDPNAVTNTSGAADNSLARFDGVIGKIIQNSNAILNDTGDMSGLNSITSTYVKSINYRNNTNTFSLALPPLNDGYVVLDGSKYDATQNGKVLSMNNGFITPITLTAGGTSIDDTTNTLTSAWSSTKISTYVPNGVLKPVPL